MNKYKVGKFLLLPLLCGTIEACDKFEAFPLEYENTPQDDAVENVLNNINPAWELELLERNDYVVAFKDKKYDKLFTRTLGWNGGFEERYAVRYDLYERKTGHFRADCTAGSRSGHSSEDCFRCSVIPDDPPDPSGRCGRRCLCNLCQHCRNLGIRCGKRRKTAAADLR